MEVRPKLDLPKTTLERWLDVASWLFVILSFVVAFVNYADLPDTIPQHFNARGEADGYGSKNMLFMLPVISFVTVAGMLFMTRFPHKYNYLSTITLENAEFEYRRMRMLLRVLSLLLSLLMLVLTWTIVDAAQGQTAKLGVGFWVLMAAILVAPWLMLLFWKKDAGRS